MSVTVTCLYCNKPRPSGTGWHSCPQAQAAQGKLQATIGGIHAMFDRPGSARQTSEQLRQRADRRRQMATGIRLDGGQVKPEFEPIDFTVADRDWLPE